MPHWETGFLKAVLLCALRIHGVALLDDPIQKCCWWVEWAGAHTVAAWSSKGSVKAAIIKGSRMHGLLHAACHTCSSSCKFAALQTVLPGGGTRLWGVKL